MGIRIAGSLERACPVSGGGAPSEGGSPAGWPARPALETLGDDVMASAGSPPSAEFAIFPAVSVPLQTALNSETYLAYKRRVRRWL
jgi:hypothetical protein